MDSSMSAYMSSSLSMLSDMFFISSDLNTAVFALSSGRSFAVDASARRSLAFPVPYTIFVMILSRSRMLDNESDMSPLSMKLS